MQIILLVIVALLLTSPILWPIFSVYYWRQIINRRFRFVLVSMGFCVFIMGASFFVVEIISNAGVRYWYLQGNECGAALYCKGFDVINAIRGLAALLAYGILGALWVSAIRFFQPKWCGFRGDVKPTV